MFVSTNHIPVADGREADFEALCGNLGVKIVAREMVGNTLRKPVLASIWPNLFATTAVYQISR